MVRLRVLLAFVVLSAAAAEARERAVMIYPRERVWFRRVFYTAHQRAMQRRLVATYDLTVHKQVSTESALFALDLRGAKLLVISAHGDPFGMFLAGRSRRTLDANDRARLAEFFSQLAPDATIMLQSCHTGRGFAHIVKEAAGPGRRVIAARGFVPQNGVEITNVEPLDARIICRDKNGRTWDCTVKL